MEDLHTGAGIRDEDRAAGNVDRIERAREEEAEDHHGVHSDLEVLHIRSWGPDSIFLHRLLLRERLASEEEIDLRIQSACHEVERLPSLLSGHQKVLGAEESYSKDNVKEDRVCLVLLTAALLDLVLHTALTFARPGSCLHASEYELDLLHH